MACSLFWVGRAWKPSGLPVPGSGLPTRTVPPILRLEAQGWETTPSIQDKAMHPPAPPPLSRQAAHLINPLISDHHCRDTLTDCASLVADLGTVLSVVHDPESGCSELRLPGLYLAFEAITGALAFEAGQKHFT